MFRVMVLCLAAWAVPWAWASPDVLLPPGASVDDSTPAQLSAEWWQWALSAEREFNPVSDLTGTHCAVGQSGAVWFLAGGFGPSKIRRTCAVPSGKSLFFPVINMIYMPARGYAPMSCDERKAAAAVNNENAIDLFAEIDGVPVPDVQRYRVTTPSCFDVYARIPEAQRRVNGFPSASDGYWLLLRPLDKGTHVIKFGGKYNRNSDAYGRMIQDIEYELLVE